MILGYSWIIWLYFTIVLVVFFIVPKSMLVCRIFKECNTLKKVTIFQRLQSFIPIINSIVGYYSLFNNFGIYLVGGVVFFVLMIISLLMKLLFPSNLLIVIISSFITMIAVLWYFIMEIIFSIQINNAIGRKFYILAITIYPVCDYLLTYAFARYIKEQKQALSTVYKGDIKEVKDIRK